MRMFVAVVPPAEVVEHLDAFLDVRRAAAPFRWAADYQLHLTLAFLGDVPDRKLDDLVERLGRAGSRRTSFEAAVAGGGAFPNVARARVLWAGLDLADHGRVELSQMATSARAAATRGARAAPARRSPPPPTAPRPGPPGAGPTWAPLPAAFRGPAWTVDRVTLVASCLGEGPRRRPRYETVDDFRLSR